MLGTHTQCDPSGERSASARSPETALDSVVHIEPALLPVPFVDRLDESGQIFDLGGYSGSGAAVLDSALVEAGDSAVVVVLWDYDPGCNPTSWSGSAQWAVVGYPTFLTVTLRPISQWAGERPTFDSFWAGMMVYPSAATKVSSDSAVALDTLRLPFSEVFPNALSPEEVFRLLRALPELCDWHHDLAGAAQKSAQSAGSAC